jgi:hypothetical protein
MNFFIDFHPNEYQNFKKDCIFFTQHYIFSETTGNFEKIPVGHCSLSSKLNCEGCKSCMIDKGISKVDLYANQQMLLKAIEEHVQWVEAVMKDVYRNFDIPLIEEKNSDEEEKPKED